ncbi:MAG: Npt1/Npt2 family nucleotide transporter [Acidobacteriota bacterium]|jgi:AAA family ATP:ADP antiporter
MGRQLLQRMLRPVAQIQEKEIFTTLLMFSYSFLAMAAYNVIKPVTRSTFIDSLGAANLPYVQLAAGLLIGVIMVGYSWLMSRLPRRWSLPITQTGIAAVLAAFWFLFRSGQGWVPVAFYILGLILGLLLISQFWTLANVIYEPRQAKRLFGFIGGGSSLGGILGSFITANYAARVGTNNLLIFSVVFMLLCVLLVTVIIRKEGVGEESQLAVQAEEGVGARRGLELLGKSKHLRLIAFVISFAAIGAAIIEQQLNMASELSKGQHAKDAITSFLGQVQLWTSSIGFLVQVVLTSRIHRYLGIGFALVLLPISLGTTGTVILLNAVLWAPELARVLDQSLRYTVDKTTREILYMPLPADLKFEAKPFVDVTVDRFAKAMGALLSLVLIKPWGLHLSWQKLSYASVAITVIWLFMALRAKRGYQMAFRQSIQDREIRPADMRLAVADPSTIETLVQELASPDERRVLYAIDILESLDKRNLITPLLLYHESSAVRVRALDLLAGILPNDSARWLPTIQRMIADESPEVRAAAVGALANIHDEQATVLVRPYLHDKNPRIVMTAAMVLSESSQEDDVAAAEGVLQGLVSDTRESAALARREFAIALRHVPKPHFRRLLIPLLSDPSVEVAAEAMQTVRQLGTADFIFVPTLISLLRDRRLKSQARELLVGYGEQILGILGHFLRDPDEDIWVRRHIPGTIARIPCQKAMDILSDTLAEPDGFLRFKVLAAIEKLHCTNSELTFSRELIESLALKESPPYLECRSCYRHLFEQEKLPQDTLLARALYEKMERITDRVYRCLGLIYPWKDIAAARWAIKHREGRSRSAALEYLDNVLTGALRKRLMPILEESISGGDSRGIAGAAEKTVRKLINDADPVLSAAAVLFAWQMKFGSLNPDLEQVLATRDARDWYVFEAASWVSAAFRLQEAKRRAMWIEPMPTVEVADRLRGLPLFASLSVDGLFRIAGAGNQVRHESGRMLYQEGTMPDITNLLVDGRVSCRASAGEAREINPPAALAFQEVLESRLMRETVRTADTSICLALGGEDCRALLADDTELVQGLFRMLCAADGADPARLVFRGEVQAGRPVIPGAGLKPIEKILVLKNIPVFSDVSADEMPGLAAIAVEVHLQKGATLFTEASPPALYALVSGAITLEPSPGEPALTAGPNDAVGTQETLGGVSLGCTAHVVRDGTALRIDREDLFDLLAQRPDLLRQLFSAVSHARAVKMAAASLDLGT